MTVPAAGRGEEQMSRYHNPAMKQLTDQQVRYAPVDVRVEQVDKAEQLLLELNPEEHYRYQDLCERITDFRPSMYPDLIVDGKDAIHDLGLVDSAVAQPQQGCYGVDLHPTLEEKAAALGYYLCSNHGFKDGNKRIGFLGMDAYLRLNGHKVVADTDDAEAMFLGIASHKTTREQLLEWVRQHLAPL